ncbi:type I glyceraldehyde-3-phosphate dehydrogenase [Syntrophotalea acetylenivorans]|uniref:Glyceraldehyde-3-phosphate dehydrogenase n=1 Tax=Syntrophotalea acetylenivorans TaxID=1842532 RepID=A0A1L3GLQ6_9BACT|nr:type I glyceraldehyde-3-phosphate dehydrogenase [Syntrophotalea acetylenivorans]APG26830.1 type I glyceraldehyde-3-phosphate dehydrogenase [Syntrophotalea acetylenivorans]
MAIKAAINGFGRIGRSIFRAAWLADDIDIVAINDTSDASALAHLLKYDSVQGIFDAEVIAEGNSLLINGKKIAVLTQPDPGALPWRELGIEVAIEATGQFTARHQAEAHLQAGASQVIITAPGTDPDVTICMGVNESVYNPQRHRIVSNASCTTNCLAPVAKVLMDNFGIIKGMMTTVHAYTNGQQILDHLDEDPRRSRAAALSIIPTTTGAARGVARVLPELEGRLDGISVRVPTPNVSLISLVVETKHPTSITEVNDKLRIAATSNFKGILEYCEQPLVSIDFNGNPASSIVDALSTNVIGGNMVKVLAWYDNEWGYSNRVVELLRHICYS